MTAGKAIVDSEMTLMTITVKVVKLTLKLN